MCLLELRWFLTYYFLYRILLLLPLLWGLGDVFGRFLTFTFAVPTAVIPDVGLIRGDIGSPLHINLLLLADLVVLFLQAAYADAENEDHKRQANRSKNSYAKHEIAVHYKIFDCDPSLLVPSLSCHSISLRIVLGFIRSFLSHTGLVKCSEAKADNARTLYFARG